MTIATTSNKAIVLGNGVNTVFNFAFAIRQASDLLVLYVDANGNETDVTANCVIALNPVAAGAQWAVGGTVTYNPPVGAIPLGTQLTIVRTMPLTQATVFANQGGNFPAVTEQTADLLEMVIQQLQEILNRTPLLSQGKDSSLYTLRLTPVANALLGWDATGKVLGTVASGGVNLVLPGAAGLAVFTGGSAFTSRTLTAGQGMAVANGSGVAGNPTVSQAGGSQVIVDANPTVWNANLGQTGVLTATNAVGNLRTVALPTNIVAGNSYILRFIQDATGGRGITWPATIKGKNNVGSPPQPQQVGSVESVYHFVSNDGASLELISFSFGTDAPIGAGRNIAARTNAATPNTKFDMSADQLVLQDAAGNSLIANVVAVTVDMGVVGANGIDAGVQALSTWYYGWVIGKPDGTIAGLASLSATAPTMPVGYTFKALVTTARSDGSTHFLKYRQFGNEVYFEGAQAVLATGTATAETPVTITSVVPTIAQSFKATVFDFGGTVAGGIFLGFAHLRIVSGVDFVPPMQLRVEGVGAGAIQRTAFPSIDVPNIGALFYLSEVSNGSSPSMSISITGFKLPLGGE